MSHTSSPSASHLVVVAASAGGLTALETLLADLPADFGAPLIAVLHLSPDYRSMMAQVLGRFTAMQVKQVEGGDRLQPGTVYCAPPDFHVLVTEEGTLRLTHTAKVEYVRPSADALFESAAEIYGASVIAVVLSGTGRDGSDGVRAVKGAGGVVLAQDEASALHFGMPRTAAETGAVDFVLPLEEIAGKLLELTSAENTSRDAAKDTAKTTEETP